MLQVAALEVCAGPQPREMPGWLSEREATPRGKCKPATAQTTVLCAIAARLVLTRPLGVQGSVGRAEGTTDTVTVVAAAHDLPICWALGTAGKTQVSQRVVAKSANHASRKATGFLGTLS